ncbi:hypothetical protein DFH09DRAFT_133233 [Mycena vulgaris]|nr:hypothetical protein DFH09DRAFT_133233 [Mycena vulgaris]
MAEIVGLIANILQLVDVVVKARSYVKDFSNAPKDQRLLLEEIQTLDTLLKKLDNRIQSTVVPSAMREVLVQLQRTRLTKKLDSHGISTRLIWPLWGKEDVQEGLNTIERFKSSVNIHLGMDIWLVPIA